MVTEPFSLKSYICFEEFIGYSVQRNFVISEVVQLLLLLLPAKAVLVPIFLF